MATAFPSALDVLPDIAAGDAMDAAGKEHDVMHDNVNDAIETMQAKIGIDNSSVVTSLDWLARRLNTARLGAFDDFERSSLTSSNFGTTVNGTGAAASIGASDATRRGLANLIVGTTATGRAAIHNGTTYIYPQSGEVEFRCAINLFTLSNSTQRYNVRAGIHDQNAAGDAVDGVYFEYDDSLSANWRTCTSNNSTRTKNNTSVAVAGGSAEIILRILVNAAWTSAQFWVNGVLVDTITTNLPGSGRNTGVCIKIEKTVGTTSVTCAVDWIYWHWNDTLVRSIG